MLVLAALVSASGRCAASDRWHEDNTLRRDRTAASQVPARTIAFRHVGDVRPGPQPCATSIGTLAYAGEAQTPDPTLIAAARAIGHGVALAFLYIDDTPGHWTSFALFHEAPVVVPRGWAVTATFGDTTAAALEAFAMTPPPELRPIRLQAGAAIDPGEVYRRPYRHQGMATFVLIRFPAWTTGRQITGVRTGDTSTPAPAAPGAH